MLPGRSCEPKWSSSDGGELRVYHGEAEDSEATREDVLPESGLLVLFDSKRVWHEVRPTQRSERAWWAGSASRDDLMTMNSRQCVACVSVSRPPVRCVCLWIVGFRPLPSDLSYQFPL